MASSDGWRKKFDDPIVTPDIKKLLTLPDAVRYLAKAAPKAEQSHETVLNAANHLTRSAERG